MEQQNKKLWFKNRYFGWGWRPVTWQGWLVLLVYIVADFALIRCLRLTHSRDGEATAKFLGGILILTAILIAICYKYGEKPRWHWGIKD